MQDVQLIQTGGFYLVDMWQGVGLVTLEGERIGGGAAHGKAQKISRKLLGDSFGGGGENVVFFGRE